MGAFLRSQKNFSIVSTTQTDEVLASGQKIQLTAVNHISVQRPDHLYAKTTSDRKEREYFYNGNSFTINSPRTGYYATVRAPATIGRLVDVLNNRYGIQLPLTDLFYWGTPRARTDLITSAIDIGPSTVNGIPAEQYALRQPGLDWQVWIQKGDKPLPLKLVLTTTTERSQPQHVVVLCWNLDAQCDPRAFTFVPTPSSKPIQLFAMPESSGEEP